MDDVDLYVCEFTSDQGQGTTGRCVSLLCGTWDGSTYRVWGARTHPAYRGKGIMKYMMTILHTKLAEGKVEHIVSTTIQENVTMRNIFQGLGYSEHAVVYGWPDSKHAHRMDTLATGDVENVHQHRWELCDSAHVLCDALGSIRGQCQAFDRVWLPGSYETVSADGQTIQRMIEQHRVHIAYNTSGIAVAVAASMEDQLDQQILSLVHTRDTRTRDILHEYRTSVSTRDALKHARRVYMDTCGGGAPSDTMLAQGLFEYIVVCRQTETGTIHG